MSVFEHWGQNLGSTWKYLQNYTFFFFLHLVNTDAHVGSVRIDLRTTNHCLSSCFVCLWFLRENDPRSAYLRKNLSPYSWALPPMKCCDLSKKLKLIIQNGSKGFTKPIQSIILSSTCNQQCHVGQRSNQNIAHLKGLKFNEATAMYTTHRVNFTQHFYSAANSNERKK